MRKVHTFTVAQDGIPLVGSALMQHRELLHKIYVGMCADGQVIPKLEDEGFQEFIEDRLTPLLLSVDGAFTKEARRVIASVLEAESRHDWDALFYHFYLGSLYDPATSIQVL